MKILLQSFSFKAVTQWQNLGVHFLQSALLSRKDVSSQVEIKILQSDVFDDLEDVYRQIRDFKPDVVGFSVYLWSVDLTSGMIGKCLNLKKKPYIMCGGKGLTSIEREFMEGNPSVDAVVKGAGESAFIEIIEHLLESGPEKSSDIAHVSGVLFRDGCDEIKETSERLSNFRLSEMQSPYLNGLIEPSGRLILETERYCPCRCTYCTWTTHSRKLPELQFPLDYIKREVSWGIEHKVGNIEFVDAAINYNTDRFIAIIDTLEKLGKPGDVNYFFFLKHDMMDQVQLKRLLRLNQSALTFLGIETFSRNALRIMKRPDRLEMIKPLLDSLCTNPNIRLMAGLVLGLPGDDAETFLKGVDFLHGYPNIHIRISILSLPPGTVMRRDAEKYKIRFHNRGVPYITHSASFDSDDMHQVFEKINTLSDRHGRVSLNTMQVPLRRLLNKESIPDSSLKRLGKDSWVPVCVTRLENGFVEAGGFYKKIYF